MHADDAAWAASTGLNARDRNSGGIGREDAILGNLRFDLAKHLNLEGEIFGHRLDDEIGARNALRQIVVNDDGAGGVIGDGERGQHHRGRGETWAGLDALGRVGVERRDIHAGARQSRGNARPHRAETDDGRVLHLALRPQARLRIWTSGRRRGPRPCRARL